MCRHIILASLAVLLSIGSCSPLDDDIIDDPIKNEQTPEPGPEPEPVPEPEPEPEPESLNVPEIRIYTEEGRNVESKDEYLDMNLFVKGEMEDALSASGLANKTESLTSLDVKRYVVNRLEISTSHTEVLTKMVNF